MKKNRMMRLASTLLVAVLITTSTISGTYAKYVTKAEGADTARVAKWGVTATITGDAFKTEYDKEDPLYDASGLSVLSSTTDKLVAPGTEGTFGGVALTGTPEVGTKVSYETAVVGKEIVDLTGWLLKDGTTFYCPLIFDINGTPINGLDYTSEADLETALINAVKKGEGYYAPNTTDFATIDDLNGSYAWEWPFEVADNNDKDTQLGDIEANSTTPVNTVSFNVKIIIEQVD